MHAAHQETRHVCILKHSCKSSNSEHYCTRSFELHVRKKKDNLKFGDWICGGVRGRPDDTCGGWAMVYWGEKRIVQQKVIKKKFVQQAVQNKKFVHKTGRKMGLYEG